VTVGDFVAKHERPGQREFREGVLKIHKENFNGVVFCRICPHNKCGFDRYGNEIPLEAHHASLPYSVNKNQDPAHGAMICSRGHRNQIHTPDSGLSRFGVTLMRLFRENPRIERYSLGNICQYKDKDETNTQ